MLFALRPVVLTLAVLLGTGAQASVTPSGTPATPGQPRHAQPAHEQAQLLKVATPAQPTGVQPTVPLTPSSLPSPAATRSEPNSPWRSWQPPLAAAVLMLVIALKRQGGSS